MTKTLKNFFDSFLSTTIYKYTLLFLVLINTLPFIKPVTEEANKVFLIWGIIILIKDFFTKKRLFKNKVHLLLWLFMAFYAITVIVNYKHNLFANIVVMGYCIINYFILYSYEEKGSPTTTSSQMKFINTVFICFSFLTGIFSIIIFFGNISFQYHSIWGTTDSIGTFDGRLWGINGNPNTCGIMSVISIAFSLMELFLKHYKKLFFRIFFIINIIIQYVVLGLTKSRGAQLALIAFIAITLMMGLYLKLIKTQKIKKFAVVLSILIGLLGGAAAYGAVEVSSPIINLVVIKLNQAHTPTEPP
ncbi:MAG: O-Antigen polymerase, partial [Oscillospiraceae bacterium]|nr:O-Antigen polymerase [Oscillospiraceae bacterium]